jgi:hypothetical protein
VSIRTKNNPRRSLAKNQNRKWSPLTYLSLCLAVLMCGLVLVHTGVLKANDRSNTKIGMDNSVIPSQTSAAASTKRVSCELPARKAESFIANKKLKHAATRQLGRRTMSPVVSAAKPFEFQKAVVEKLAPAALELLKEAEGVATPVSEPAETKSDSQAAIQTSAASTPEPTKDSEVSSIPVQDSGETKQNSPATTKTSAQTRTVDFPAPPSSDATPRWIPPANRRGIVGTGSGVNKPMATEQPSADLKVASSPGSEQAKSNGVGSSSSSNAGNEQSQGIDKRKIREALDKAAEAIKKKGSEFKGTAEMKGATTTGKTGAAGAVAKPIVQDPPAPFKAEISKPPLVYPAEFIGDVRLLPQGISAADRNLVRPELELEGPEPVEKKPLPEAEQPGKVQPPTVPTPSAPMPAFSQSFQGLNFASNGAGWPPDTVGDVGPNHYVQAVNTSVGIYNKTGTQLAAFTFNSLWSGSSTGTACDNSHQGDPTVIYSRQNNRWIVADFAFTAATLQNGPYYECIAVSKTANPVIGGWWLFAYRADDAMHPWLPDYPKMGIWPDGLYMGANMFDCTTATCSAATYQETRAYAFNITDLVTGAALRSVVADTNSTAFFSVFPSNYRGTPPPAGRENLFVSESGTLFTFEVWKFHVDFVGSGSTFTGPTNVSQTSYTLATTTVTSPGNALDSLRERIMMQVQYRNIGGAESLWVNHTVRTGLSPAPAGIQWAQINVTGGTIISPPIQQQIYGNLSADGIHRWMGALAVDNQGNMALGYSASNTALNPDIRYAGRLAGDPLNSLPQTEVSMIPAAVTRGTQSGSCGGTCIRWGDYSSMSVDPSDECTFWYTQEYYETTGLSWLTRIGSFKFPSCVSAPTEAKVKTFTADGFDDGRVLLRWSSGYESGNLGYNIYRESNGRRDKINPQTIAGSSLVSGPKIALNAGKSYAWADQSAPNGTRYWLEDIDLNGKSSWTGPAVINARTGHAPNVDQSALLTKIGMASTQMSTGQGSVQVERTAEIATPTPDAIKVQTDIAGQPAVKLSVKKEGWYRVSQPELLAAGMDPNADARNLQMYIDGRQVPIIVNGEMDGTLGPSDSVEFYGVGLKSAATDTHVYWLVVAGQRGTRIMSLTTAGGPSLPANFIAGVERKDRTLYFSALRNGDAENFFGPVVSATPVDQTLTLTNLASTSAQAGLDVYLQGVTQAVHQARVTLNGTVLGTVTFNGQERGKGSFQVPQSLLREGANSVQLVALAGGPDISLVDTIRISYTRTFMADNNLLRVSVKGGQPVNIGGFTSADIRVMDVTDANNPQELKGTISGAKTTASISLTPPGLGARTLLAFTAASATTAAAKANIPSNWHEEGLQYDYVMITTQDLKPSLNPLKSLRESRGLSVAVVEVEDLFDEFSFGNKSPQAIKDFLRFTVSNWRRAPRFVLFAGDSSYDPKNYLGFGDSDLVPTKLFDSVYMEAATDDWFVDFQSTGLPDIASGRLPVRNATEASAMVAKILSYENSSSSNSALLVADLNDGHNFAGVAAGLRALLPSSIQVQEIVRGTSDDATIKSQLIAAINQGNTIVTYNGHGSLNVWHGNILTNDDAPALTNNQKLSFFIMMTCLNGYFDDPALDSLAESLLKAGGGAFAVWASSAQCEPGPQEILNLELYQQLFGGSSMSIGEAAARAKQAVSDPDVRRSWILFGDPAMRLK